MKVKTLVQNKHLKSYAMPGFLHVKMDVGLVEILAVFSDTNSIHIGINVVFQRPKIDPGEPLPFWWSCRVDRCQRAVVVARGFQSGGARRCTSFDASGSAPASTLVDRGRRSGHGGRRGGRGARHVVGTEKTRGLRPTIVRDAPTWRPASHRYRAPPP